MCTRVCWAEKPIHDIWMNRVSVNGVISPPCTENSGCVCGVLLSFPLTTQHSHLKSVIHHVVNKLCAHVIC